MIPGKKVTAYATSAVTPEKSRHDVEYMLDKQGVKIYLWKKDDPQNTYLIFQVVENEQKLAFKVNVPFIEKETKDPSASWRKITVFDEQRSYRFFFHIFKSMLLNTQIGMSLQQVFGNYLVVGSLPDGTPLSVSDKVSEMIANKQVPTLPTGMM